jgi:hypothetical protein
MPETSHASLVIYGGTAPGIVTAIRAAREGLDVVLVTPTSELGGSLPSLGALETHFRGVRAPLLHEFATRVVAHYRAFGENSEAYRTCISGMMISFEPKVAATILRQWIAAESRICWRTGYVPVHVERTGRRLQVVQFAAPGTGKTLRLAADAFVEASYEGDLLALAGARCRIGREARNEFGEPSAGRVFTRWRDGVYPRAAAEGHLGLVTARATTSEPLPGSTGEGDDNIQSYSFRLCLTDDPANRRLLSSRPDGYDRSRFAPLLLSVAAKAELPLPFHHRFLIYSLREMAERDHLFHGHVLPNRKRSWNATNLTGGGRRYPTANTAERREIARMHLGHALGLLWFLQNDPEMPAELREMAREWGLARDEFVENDNLPPQLYIREARRLVGRSIFTEHDALIAPGLGRAPIHADSIGITEFSLDSLACTTQRLPGGDSLCDGQLFQMEVSRPGQVPFGALLPREFDNLLVVTTVSATHVGWGTIRQTPTLMHLAESAAWAIVLAAQEKIPPAHVDIDQLQRTLVERGVMITFFNDCDMSTAATWVPAVQYCGTKGFFKSYDAAPGAPLTPDVAREWALVAGIDPRVFAERGGEPVSRGEACERCYLCPGAAGPGARQRAAAK